MCFYIPAPYTAGAACKNTSRIQIQTFNPPPLFIYIYNVFIYLFIFLCRYKTYQMTREKLLKAVEMTDGFDGVD